MKERGLSTLFRHGIFTIDAPERKNWDYEKLEQYLLNYKLMVNSNVINSLDEDMKILFDEMLIENSYFIVKKNNGKRYKGEKQYIKCVVPAFILNYFKRIFASTIIYEADKKEIPESEYITFEFDTNGQMGPTVTITDLHLYVPKDNPYHNYARNAVATLSIEAIGINNYGFSEDGKVKDFYNWDKMSKWKKTSSFFERGKDGKIVELKDKNGVLKESVISGEPGIYMLYDENLNEFYIGKAKDLRLRILQHANNADGKDPIPGFTHYRYSVINLEYIQFLYLIENAGIHDTAWLLNMDKAQKIRTALCKNTKNSLNDCKMVNTHERQRKIEKQ